MIKNNVKENLFDDEENIYVGLSDLVNLRESAELTVSGRTASIRYISGKLCTGSTYAAERPVGYLPSVCRSSTQGNGILLYEGV